MDIRDTIFDAFKARKPETVAVPIPEIGQTWHVKELSGADDHHMQDRMDEMVKDGKSNAWFVCCVVVAPETGKRVFDDLDVDNVNRLPTKVLRRVWLAGGKINGMRDKDIEATEKNSDKEASAASSSTSSSKAAT